MKKTLTVLCLLLPLALLHAQKTGMAAAAQTQQPRTGIYQKYSVQLPANATAETVRDAVLQAKPMVTAQGCDLHLRDAIHSPGGFHCNFDQTWNGIPIHLAGIKANLNPQMRFMNLLDHLCTFSGTPLPHQRTDQSVAAALPAMLDQGEVDFQLFPNSRCYYQQEGQLVAAHRVSYTANTQTWELILADDDLHVLSRRDVAAYRKPLGTTTDTTGNAMVFIPDPLTSSVHTYGAPYHDNDDLDIAELNAQRQPVTLKNITWNGTAFELIGPYVDLDDRENPLDGVATSTDGNFVFTRAQQGFEDAMVYYHIDTFQRYVQSLGFTNLMNGQVHADPHGLNGQDNSHFISTDSRVAFGEGGVDDAEDADVIIHEYGHALSHSGSPFTNSGVERQGLDEGIGDYVATTYSRDISYVYWKNVFTWDGHNEFWSGRSASSPAMYPPSNTGDIYAYGTIWVSALMEVWPQIGKNACDKVFFESLYGHATNMTLTDAALVHIDADSTIFGGMHHDQYQDAFCTRGILAGTLPGQGCFVGTDEPDPSGLSWELYPNPAAAALHLRISGYQPRYGFHYAVLDLLGRELLGSDVKAVVTDIDLPTMPNGIYLLQLRSNAGWMQTRRFLVGQ